MRGRVNCGGGLENAPGAQKKGKARKGAGVGKHMIDISLSVLTDVCKKTIQRCSMRSAITTSERAQIALAFLKDGEQKAELEWFRKGKTLERGL